MKHCVIFCAGECAIPGPAICKNALVIAADGGLNHVRRLQIQPDLVLGDFDSLGYIPENAEVFPVEKDDTDSMLAIKKGLHSGCDRFYLYGALDGQRVDHTMANFQALHYLSRQGAQGYLIGKYQIVTAITNAGLHFDANCTGHLSVFAAGSDANGVSIRGAKYELHDATLTASFPLGVSNQFVGREVDVCVRDGTLLLIWDACNGIR